MTRDLRGGDPATVRSALQSEDPLPGTAGFAGRVDDVLVRDVLGRQPLFLSPTDSGWTWGRRLADLDDPVPFPAGSVLDVEALADPGLDPASDPRRVWTLPDPEPVEDHQRAIRQVRAALAATDVPDCPVAFSGGVDSALLGARSTGPLYVAGFPDCHDVEAAREAARAMDRSGDLHVVEITHEDLRAVVPDIVCATGRTNAMDVSIVAPLYLVARRVRADGYDRLAVGQGADELFGGYAKVANAPDDTRVEADTVRGATREVLQSLPDQLARDVPALEAAGVEPVAPLLDDRIVSAALALPGELLASEDRRKVALRRAAREWLPESVATREKKAVQYGTYVSRELDRLARQAGYKRRMDDHVSRYVASLVE